MPDEHIRVFLDLVTGQYKREAAGAAQATGEISKAAAAGKQNMGFLERSFGSAAGALRAFGLTMGAVGLKRFIQDVTQAATDLGESVNAVQKVFGDASDTILEFGKVSAQAAGLATAEFQQMASVTGSLLQNYGFSADEAAKETIRLTQRASDMASVFNTDVSQAMEAINSALRGQSRPITEFAVNLRQADINARAVALGLAESTGSVDSNAEAIATLNLIYEQTAKTQGDFLQTTKDAANAGRQAGAAWTNLKATIGRVGLPALASGLNTINIGLLEWQASFKGANQEAAKTELAFARAVENIQGAVARGQDPVNAFADGLLHIAANGQLTTAQLEALAAQAGVSANQWDLFAEALENEAEMLGIAPDLINEILGAIGGVGLAAGESAPLIDRAAGAMGRTGDAADRAASKVSDLMKAQRDYRLSLLESVSPALTALRAMERLGEAQDKVTELQKEGKTNTDEYSQAQLELAGAIFEAQVALNAFDASGVQRAIDGVATALGKSKQEAQDLLTELGLIDGKEVTTVVRLNVTSNIPLGKLDRNSLAQILSGTVTTGTPQPRQHGGRLGAGQLGLVGEAGPELFIPDTSGLIISNRQLMAALGRQSSRSATINVISPTSHTLNQDLQYGALLANHMTLAS